MHNEDPRSIICDYSGASATTRRPPAPSASASGTSDNGGAAAQTYKNQVDELQDKVIQLEALIKGGSNKGGTAPSTSSSDSRTPPGATSNFAAHSGVSAEFWNQPRAAFDQASTNDLLTSMMPGSSAPSSTTFEHFNAPSAASYTDSSAFASASPQQAAGASYQTGPSPPSGDETDPFFDLIYPGWPSDLPPPSLTRKMLDLFFTRPHCGSYLIIRSKFEAAFSFPPTSSRFPSVALIHSMLAVAYTCVPSTFNVENNSYWKKEARDTSPAVYHGRRGKVCVTPSVCFLGLVLRGLVFPGTGRYRAVSMQGILGSPAACSMLCPPLLLGLDTSQVPRGLGVHRHGHSHLCSLWPESHRDLCRGLKSPCGGTDRL